MSLFFCPERPLTRGGQVLLCAAGSIFAALLLVAWSPAHADGCEASGGQTADCALPIDSLTSGFAPR